MNNAFENPYADYGKMVHGERFIGRTEIITKIENRIFTKAPGNLAITGMHRRQKLLAKCRNPLAHNRAEVLQPHERPIIEGYCNEILTTLRGDPSQL